MLFAPQEYTLLINNTEWTASDDKLFIKDKLIEVKKSNLIFIKLSGSVFIPALALPMLKLHDYKYVIEHLYEPYWSFFRMVENSEVKLVITGEKPNLETLPALFYLNNITMNNKFDSKLRKLLPFIKIAQKVFYNSRNYVPLIEAIKSLPNINYTVFYIPYEGLRIPVRIGGKKKQLGDVDLSSKSDVINYINTTIIRNRGDGVVSPLYCKQEVKNLYFLKCKGSPVTIFISHNPKKVVLIDYDGIGLDSVMRTLQKLTGEQQSGTAKHVYSVLNNNNVVMINNDYAKEFWNIFNQK